MGAGGNMRRTLVVRSGAQVGPASRLDVVGMGLAVVAPILLFGYVFIVAAWINADLARHPNGRYSHISDLMSDLGDRGDWVGDWFVWINVVIAFILAVTTYVVLRRLPVGVWVVLLLGVASALTVLVGVVRCQTGCIVPSDDAEPVRWQQIVHFAAAAATGVVIVALPWRASQDLPADGPYRWFRRASRWVFRLALSCAIILVVTLVLSVVGGPDVTGLAQRALWIAGYAWIVLAAVVMFDKRNGVRDAPFDVTRLQENVIYGRAATTHGLVVVCGIRDPTMFRAALARALDDDVIRRELPRPLPTGAHRRPFTVTVGFTRVGLDVLGAGYKWTATTCDPFGEGMVNRAALLGDVDGSDPTQWEEQWRFDDLHVLFWMVAEGQRGLHAARGAIAPLLAATQVRVCQEMQARNGREPFGFADDVSQPWIDGVHPHDPRRFGGGKLVRRRGQLAWEPIAVGEFILGEIDEGGDVSLVPAPSAVFQGATFLVIRKLEQNVDEFHAWSARTARARPRFRADLEEKLVGRRRDGTPLASSRGYADASRNDFTFGSDPEGFACPMSAHIRRANPRDGLGFDGEPAHRHRMIRRGMPYFDPDGSEGLVFAAMGASLLDKFEFVQRQWLNDGNPFRVGSAPDLVAGSWAGTRHVVIHDRDGPVVARVEHPFVRTRGGAYFVLPAMAGLWYLAASKTAEEALELRTAAGGEGFPVPV